MSGAALGFSRGEAPIPEGQGAPAHYLVNFGSGVGGVRGGGASFTLTLRSATGIVIVSKHVIIMSF